MFTNSRACYHPLLTNYFIYMLILHFVSYQCCFLRKKYKHHLKKVKQEVQEKYIAQKNKYEVFRKKLAENVYAVNECIKFYNRIVEKAFEYKNIIVTPIYNNGIKQEVTYDDKDNKPCDLINDCNKSLDDFVTNTSISQDELYFLNVAYRLFVENTSYAIKTIRDIAYPHLKYVKNDTKTIIIKPEINGYMAEKLILAYN